MTRASVALSSVALVSLLVSAGTTSRLDDPPSTPAAQLTEARQILARAAREAARIEDSGYQGSTLTELVEAQVQAEDYEGAFKTATSVPGRCFGLQALAHAQAIRGEGAEALKTLATAAEIRGVSLAGSFEDLQKIAVALARRGDFSNAQKAAAAILVEEDKEERYRQWAAKLVAIGGIAGAQAKAGHPEAAKTLQQGRDLVASVKDSELRPSLLLELVVGQAAGGDRVGALKSADAIPQPSVRQRAFSRVATQCAESGDFAGAQMAVARLEPAWRNFPLTQLAEAQIKAGDRDGAAKTLQEVGRRLASLKDPEQRLMAAVIVGSLQARANDVAGARQTLKGSPNEPALHSMLLGAIAAAEARSGKTAEALKTMESIQPEMRAAGLVELAQVLGDRGQREEASKAAEQARRLMTRPDIDETLRALTLPSLAKALAAAGDFRAALELGSGLKESENRATVFRGAARAVTRRGQTAMALAIAESIEFPYQRTWTLLGVAEGILERLHPERQFPWTRPDFVVQKRDGAAAVLRRMGSGTGHSLALLLVGLQPPGASDNQAAQLEEARRVLKLAREAVVALEFRKELPLRHVAMLQLRCGDSMAALRTVTPMPLNGMQVADFAEILARRRQFPEARELADAAGDYRDNALSALAREQAKAGELAGAAATIQAIRSPEYRHRPLVTLGSELVRKGDVQAALTAARQGGPGAEYEVLVIAAEHQRRAGDARSAKSSLARARQLLRTNERGPVRDSAAGALIRAYAALQEFKEALAILTEFDDTKGRSWLNHHELARLAAEAGNDEIAMKAAERASLKEGDGDICYRMIAEAQVKRGDLPRAEATAGNIRGPWNRDFICVQIVRAHISRQDLSGARAFISRARPEDPSALLNALAEGQHRQGDEPGALSTLAEARRAAAVPEHGTAAYRLGEVARSALRIGQAALAREISEQGLERAALAAPRDDNLDSGTLLLVGLGKVHAELGNRAAAVEELQRAAKLARSLKGAERQDRNLAEVAEVQMKLGYLDAARDTLEAVSQTERRAELAQALTTKQSAAGEIQAAVKWATERRTGYERALALIGIVEGILGKLYPNDFEVYEFRQVEENP